MVTCARANVCSFAVLLFAIWYFGISVLRTAEGIRNYVYVRFEHDHEYEHITQSSALSVVGELSSNQALRSFFFSHYYTRVA